MTLYTGRRRRRSILLTGRWDSGRKWGRGQREEEQLGRVTRRRRRERRRGRVKGGRSGGGGQLNFYLDVRPKMNSLEGIKMNVGRWVGWR